MTEDNFGDFDPFLVAQVFQDTLFASSKGESIMPTCEHTNIAKDETGVSTCSKCGMLVETLDHSQEWRTFGGVRGGTQYGTDQSRCHSFSTNNNTIKAIFNAHSLQLSQAMLEMVEMRFAKVLEVHENKVVRGTGRTAIAAVCLFYCFNASGETRPSKEIRNMFNVTQKKFSQATKQYFEAFPEDAKAQTTPENLIPHIMKLTGVPHQEHYRNIVSISRYFTATSSLIERSCPQSVAAATVYFYLCLFPQHKEALGLTKKTFAAKVDLSDITITKIVMVMVEIAMIVTKEWNEENAKYSDPHKPQRKTRRKNAKVLVH